MSKLLDWKHGPEFRSRRGGVILTAQWGSHAFEVVRFWRESTGGHLFPLYCLNVDGQQRGSHETSHMSCKSSAEGMCMLEQANQVLSGAGA